MAGVGRTPVRTRLIAAVGAPPEQFLRALGYPIGDPVKTLDAAIAAILELDTLSDEEKQAIITLLRARVT